MFFISQSEAEYALYEKTHNNMYKYCMSVSNIELDMSNGFSLMNTSKVWISVYLYQSDNAQFNFNIYRRFGNLEE